MKTRRYKNSALFQNLFGHLKSVGTRLGGDDRSFKKHKIANPIFAGICMATILAITSPLNAQVIVNYDPLGPQNDTIPLPASSTDIQVTAGSLSWSGAQGFENTNVYPIGTITSSASINLGQYITFTVNGNVEYDTVRHDSFSYGNGPSSGAIRSSVDGFATNLDVLTGLPANGASVNVFDVSSLGTINGSVEFRIYYWDSNNGFADINSSAFGATGITVKGPAIFDTGITPVNDDSCVWSDDEIGSQIAIPFSVPSDHRVTGVEWFGAYNFMSPPANDLFRIEVYADMNGQPAPGQRLYSRAIAPQRTEVFPNEFRFRANAFDFFTVSANTTYWLVIRDVGLNEKNFCLSGLLDGGVSSSSNDGGMSWNEVNVEVAARLFGEECQSPSNDDWEGIGIFDDNFPVTVNGNNVCATVETDEQQIGNTGSTVWWFIDAPESGMMTVDTFGSDFDTQLHVYKGFALGFPNLIPVANNDDSNGTFQSQVSFFVNADECFELRVGGYRSFLFNSGEQGDIQLNINFEPGVLIGDINCDGVINLLDVEPFVAAVSSGEYDIKADINEDGTVNLLDVGPFIALLAGG